MDQNGRRRVSRFAMLSVSFAKSAMRSACLVHIRFLQTGELFGRSGGFVRKETRSCRSTEWMQETRERTLPAASSGETGSGRGR